MKVFTLLMISCLMLTLTLSQDKKARGALSDAELQQIRDRLPCLMPGITLAEAFDLLGIDLKERYYALSGSGPTDDYRLLYQLTEASNENGYNLVVVHDREGRFKRAEIACWENHPQCEKENEKAKLNPKACPTPTGAPNKSLEASGFSLFRSRDLDAWLVDRRPVNSTVRRFT